MIGRRILRAFAASIGSVLLLAPQAAQAAPPPNDDLADRQVIVSVPYAETRDTLEATVEPDEPQSATCGPHMGATVWYEYTAADSAVLHVDTLGSDFDTVVTVWQRDALGYLAEVGCNDDFRNLESFLVFGTTAGQTYLLQVGGYDGDRGDLRFLLEPHRAGSISGTITSSAGGGLQHACVDVYSAADPDDLVGYAATGASGQYAVGGLPDGSYRVAFVDCSPDQDHLEEWYDDSPDHASAQDVVISGGSAVTGIDAELQRATEATLWVYSFGGGALTSDPAGIDCGEDCEEVYPIDSTVTLTAIPESGWELYDWSWGCPLPQGRRCTVLMKGNQDVEAEFVPDQPGPETVITDGPLGWVTNSRTATFSFRSSTEGATFRCSLDGQDPIPCSSPSTYTEISHGEHRFEVAAIDGEAVDDPTPAAWEWQVDIIPPETTLYATPPTLSASSEATFVFDADEPDVVFRCSLDGAPMRRCPTAVEYTELAEGRHTFRVRGMDSANNVEPVPAEWTWEVDQTAPETSILSAPSGTVRSRSATIEFDSSEPGATFECAFDVPVWSPCNSPKAYDGLPEGPHTFGVRAVDAAGNKDPSPEEATWTVDTQPPQTTITARPPEATGSTSATFGFAASEPGSTFECSLDGQAFEPCASPASYTGLAEGEHTFRVRATDAVGNVDPSPAEAFWRVDLGAPDTAITSGPSGMTTSAEATFAFTSDEPGSTFGCSLDGGAYAVCSSPKTYTNLSEGNHTFRVRATDQSGKVDPTPAERTWSVDSNGPLLSFRRPTSGVYVNDQHLGGTGPIVVVGAVTVEATAVDPQSGIATFRFDVNGTPVPGSQVTVEGDVYRFTFRPPSAGQHLITFWATNGSGLQTGSSTLVYGVPTG